MPELPEVEITKRIFSKHLKNTKVTKVDLFKKNLRWEVCEKIKTLFTNSILLEPYRLGKFIIVPTNTKISLIIHLGMTGYLKINYKKQPLEKHDHIKLTMINKNNEKIFLLFNDTRRFGFIDYCDENSLNKHFLIKNLGVEPLTEELNKVYLYEKLKQKSISVKVALLDQRIIAGIGNIYASEILFLSRLHPLFNVKYITNDLAENLCSSIKIILLKAIKKGGTTIQDFKNPDGKLGYFNQELLVYSREGKRCLICASIIKKILLSGRSSFFCEKCQSIPTKFLKEL